MPMLNLAILCPYYTFCPNFAPIVPQLELETCPYCAPTVPLVCLERLPTCLVGILCPYYTFCPNFAPIVPQLELETCPYCAPTVPLVCLERLPTCPQNFNYFQFVIVFNLSFRLTSLCQLLIVPNFVLYCLAFKIKSMRPSES